MTTLLTVVVVASALATGLAGGVFAAFSTFVLPGLPRLAPADAPQRWSRSTRMPSARRS